MEIFTLKRSHTPFTFLLGIISLGRKASSDFQGWLTDVLEKISGKADILQCDKNHYSSK